MRRRIILVLGVLLPFVMVLPVIAQSVADYENVTQIIIENGTGADLTNVAVRVPINAANLVDGGFLAADGQDILVLDAGSAENRITAQFDGNQSSWWFPINSLAAGASETQLLYTGQNTTTADNPQHLHVQESPNDQLTDADNGAWENNTIAIFAGSLTLDAFPATEGWIMYKDGATAWEAGINSSGAPYLQINCSAGACAPSSPITITGSVLTIGTSYDIAWAAQVGSSSANDGIWVDGVLDVGWSGVGTMATNATGVIALASISADVGQLRFYDGTIYNHSTPGACTVATTCWQFEPTEISETQEGNAANAWHWLGTTTNTGTAGSTTDAAYTFVRDMSNITVIVGPAVSTAAPLVSQSETDPEVVSGTVTFDIGGNAVTYADQDDVANFGFPFNILAISADAGDVPLQLLALSIVLLGSLIAGFLTLKGTKIPGAAILMAAVSAGMFIYLTPVTNGVILLVAIPSVAMLVLIPQPFEARS